MSNTKNDIFYLSPEKIVSDEVSKDSSVDSSVDGITGNRSQGASISKARATNTPAELSDLAWSSSQRLIAHMNKLADLIANVSERSLRGVAVPCALI